MLKKFKNGKEGFTLIELLVVIAIIGILSGIVVASLGGQRARARDARKVSELQSVALALQIFYDSNGRYPTTIAGTDGLPTSLLAKEPKDTTNQSYLIYKPYQDTARATLSADCTTAPKCQGYQLAADLEQNDSVVMAGDDDINGAGTGAIQGADDTKDCTATATAGKFCYDVVNK